MMKNIIFGILLVLVNFTFSQSKNDTNDIKEILKIQLKIADKTLKQKFVLSKSSMPYDINRVYFKPDSIHNHFTLGKILNWSNFKPISKFVELESDSSENYGYSFFMSTPIFNKEMTKCRFVVNFHFGEWGGYTRLCYYEKRRRKWKLTKQTRIISVN